MRADDLGRSPEAAAAGQRVIKRPLLEFELGKISAGKTAELAGFPKPVFLVKLADFGVSASTLSAEDVAQDIANA